MGLLQILTRRPGNVKTRGSEVQQLDGTTALREYPISEGNRKSSTTSLANLDDSEMAAPAPSIHTTPTSPRIRPGTSSSTSNYSVKTGPPRVAQRPPREQRGPPVSFRKPSLVSLSQNSATEGGRSDIGSSVGTLGRSNSTTSTSTRMSRRSRDLLDVLEEIRPVQFRTRLLASGAKEYCEDVADRNIRRFTKWSPTAIPQNHFGSEREYVSSRSSRRQPSLLGNDSKHFGPLDYVHSTYGIRDNHDSTLREASSSPDLGDSGEPGSFSWRKNKNRLSLNTYTPTGLDSTRTPRSAVSTPGLRIGTDHRDFGSTSPQNEMQYHMSPMGHNFSVPRLPGTLNNWIRDREVSGPEMVDHVDQLTDKQPTVDTSASDGPNYHHGSGASIGHVSLGKTGVRFSSQTFRSSLASSVASRIPSMDFTPLDCPRFQSHYNLGTAHPDERDASPDRRARSLSSHRPSQSVSSEDGLWTSRTKSLGVCSAPSGLGHLFEIDERDVTLRTSSHRDFWNLATPSNDSVTSSSHAYSGGSGSGRPESRHTKTTSVDSTQHSDPSSCKSDGSFWSALTSHAGYEPDASFLAAWSPAAARSTGFNIDDYISSDEESFDEDDGKARPRRTRRPRAEGEEELLFRSVHGFNGALPGLSESMGDDSCPPPVVSRFRGMSSWQYPPVEEEDEEEDEEDEEKENEEEEIGTSESDTDQFSVDWDIPATVLPIQRQPRSLRDAVDPGTFGRTSAAPFGEGMEGMCTTSTNSVAGITPSTAVATADERKTTPSARRHQQRLSALGTPHGQAPPRAVAAEDAVREEVERLDHSAAARLWKSAKARKRADDARSIREQRSTRAFGGQGVTAGPGEVGLPEVVRGRTLVR